jgi:hypothetical protein
LGIPQGAQISSASRRIENLRSLEETARVLLYYYLPIMTMPATKKGRLNSPPIYFAENNPATKQITSWPPSCFPQNFFLCIFVCSISDD